MAASFGAATGCNGGSDCTPSYYFLDLPASRADVIRVTATGNCTGRCGALDTTTNGDPALGCNYITAVASAAGPCMVRAEMGDGTAFAAQLHGGSHPAGSECSGLYVKLDSAFAIVDAGSPDAAQSDSAAE